MPRAKASAVIDTRVIYCGDNLDQLRKLPDGCVDLIYIDPPFNSNRDYEVFWGETKEKRSFEDRHESTKAYIDYMRPRCVELHRVLKKTGSFYYHCDWHASHYVKVMLDQIFGENNFQNEIVWKRTTAHADTHGFGHVHDIVFRYSNGGKSTFNIQLKEYSQDYLENYFVNEDQHVAAAQKLKRQWIGIDISPTACRVMAKRLKKDCGLKEDEKLQQIGRGFVVRDLPKTEEELEKYPPFEFENWAVVALGGTKNARQVGDMGIDGRIYPSAPCPNAAAHVPAKWISWTSGIRSRLSNRPKSAVPTSTLSRPS
jgi:adenine specific DNA methylase Mod